MPTKPTFDQRAADMVTRAISAIVLDDPFYGFLILRQAIIQDPTIDTAGTNGKYIRYSPTFIRKQTQAQVKGLMKHEVLHTAYLHNLRRGKRDKRRWDMACDYVINALLQSTGVSLPDGGLFDSSYADKSAEQVYDMLPESASNEPQIAANGKFAPDWNIGGVEDAPGSEDPQTNELLTSEAKADLIQAVNTAKIMGKCPAELERLVNDIKSSKVPWKDILARFFRSTAKDDVTWAVPKRRYLPYGIYLPSLRSEALGPIVIAVDTSGSVGTEELSEFFGAINAIMQQTKPEEIHVVYCDATVGGTQKFTAADLPLSIGDFKPTGGGGTAFEPVFDYVRDNNLKPNALLYLTDMYGSFPQQPPAYPVIWCATSGQKAPFGQTIRLS